MKHQIKRTWKAGRKSICGQEKSVAVTYQICPASRKALDEYCKANNLLPSIVVNQAIIAYIKNNQAVEGIL